MKQKKEVKLEMEREKTSQNIERTERKRKYKELIREEKICYNMI
jgi:hypothetical protein